MTYADITTHPLAPVWPPARIHVETPLLALRLPTDADLVALGALAREGVHAVDAMPFASPWSQQPAPLVPRNALQWHMQARASWAPERWTLLLVAFVDGEVAGAQDIGGADFGTCREVESASWLGRRFQGRGLGTEMRQAMLHLAFDGLGALAANSGAWEDNPASIRVSEKCGYERNGVKVLARRRGPSAPGGSASERATELRFRLERDGWLRERRDDIEVHGLDDELRELVGLATIAG